jgi:ABC-type transport system involved in cytochrome c biogenesis permease component
MNANVARLLGAAFLTVVVTSMIGEILLSSAVGSGSISDIMVRAADAPTLMRASVVAELMTSVGIVVLAVLLYVVLSVENRTLALVALGLWLAEAIVLAVDEPARGRCRSLR